MIVLHFLSGLLLGHLGSFRTDTAAVHELKRMCTDPQTDDGPAKDVQRTKFTFLIR